MEKDKEIIKKTNNSVVALPLIMIFLVLLAGIGGWYLNETWLKTEDNITAKEPTTKEEVKYLDTNSVLVRNLLSNYTTYMYGDALLIQTMYKEDSYKISSMSDMSKQQMIMAYLNYPVYTTEKKFQDANIILFGPDSNLENKDIMFSEDGNGVLYEYDETNKVYNHVAEGLGGINPTTLIRNIDEAKIEDSELVITVSVGKMYPNENNENVYEDAEGNIYDELDSEQLTKFEHHYNYDEENMNYYLIEVVKIK